MARALNAVEVQMPHDRPAILRLQHVSLPIPGTPDSVTQTRRFYGEILGLREKPHPPSLPGVIVWFDVGDQELHLFSDPSGVAANDRSRRHPCFQVEDVRDLRDHLDAAGVATRDHDGDIPGRPRFFAVDPFGNNLEFAQFEPDHW